MWLLGKAKGGGERREALIMRERDREREERDREGGGSTILTPGPQPGGMEELELFHSSVAVAI